MPSLTSDFRNVAVSGRSFRSFFLIQDPLVNLSEFSQNEASCSRYFLTHATQREPECAKSRHMNLSENTVELSCSRRISSPPSFLEAHKSSHETFAFEVICGEADHRNAEAIFSMMSRQLFGNRKVEHQKFMMLAITNWISWSLPAYDKVLLTKWGIAF